MHRQQPGDRHAPAPKQRQPHAPVREIGEGDEGALADAEQFREDAVRTTRGLERLAEDRIVEAVVGIVGKVHVGVALHDRKPARDRRGDIRRIELKPARVHLPLVAKRRHQRPVAATHVEHARAARDVASDNREVGPERAHLEYTSGKWRCMKISGSAMGVQPSFA